MAYRAYWKGHIRLSLVTFPVRLHAAITATKKISLHKYDRETGERIHYQNINEEGEEVPKEDIIKGYEYEKGSFISIEDEDLEKLRLESKHTIDLVQFTDAEEIDPIYFDKSYFIVPDGEIAQEAFLTIREALRRSKKSALGQVVLSNKERIAAIRPCHKGLIMHTLRYNYEVREASAYFDNIPENIDINEDQLELAEKLIDSKYGSFEPEKFKDRYQEGLLEIINAKLQGKAPEVTVTEDRPEKVVDIMDALKKSLEQSGKSQEAA